MIQPITRGNNHNGWLISTGESPLGPDFVFAGVKHRICRSKVRDGGVYTFCVKLVECNRIIDYARYGGTMQGLAHSDTAHIGPDFPPALYDSLSCEVYGGYLYGGYRGSLRDSDVGKVLRGRHAAVHMIAHYFEVKVAQNVPRINDHIALYEQQALLLADSLKGW